MSGGSILHQKTPWKSVKLTWERQRAQKHHRRIEFALILNNESQRIRIWLLRISTNPAISDSMFGRIRISHTRFSTNRNVVVHGSGRIRIRIGSTPNPRIWFGSGTYLMLTMVKIAWLRRTTLSLTLYQARFGLNLNIRLWRRKQQVHLHWVNRYAQTFDFHLGYLAWGPGPISCTKEVDRFLFYIECAQYRRRSLKPQHISFHRLFKTGLVSSNQSFVIRQRLRNDCIKLIENLVG